MFSRTYPSSFHRVLCLFGLLVMLSGFAETAAASDIPRFLRPGKNPTVYSLGIGPSIGIIDSAFVPGTQFQLSNTFGYHLSGKARGAAVGLDLDLSFANGSFIMQMAPRFWWDFQLIRNLGLYLSPFARIGYNLRILSVGTLTDVKHSMGLQLGLRVKLMMAGRFYAYFQPVAFDMFISNFFTLRINMALGAGVSF